MARKKQNRTAEAFIEKGEIVIRISIGALPDAFRAGIDLGAIDEGYGALKITDARLFAHDVVRALNDEDEDGTTPIHRLFDDAITEAIEQGAEGLEEDSASPPDDRGSKTAHEEER